MNQTVKLLTWIRDHGGFWYLLCTPNEEHMNLGMMQRLIGELTQAGLEELIFVLFMVHREDTVMKNVFEYLLLEEFIAHWEEDKEFLVDWLLDYFQ